MLKAFDPERCANEALAAFNADTDDEHGVEHLVDAARCLEMAGMAAKALRLHQEIVKRYPQSVYIDESQATIGRMFTNMLDLEAGANTALGRECLAPLAELGTNPGPSGTELIAAADCVADGVLVATALHYRELAASQPDSIDVEANDEQIVMLSRVLDGLKTRADAHAKAVAKADNDQP